MATIQSVLFNLLINAIPIMILLIPFLFIIKKKTGLKVYARIFWGITIFFLIYYVMPTIFQVGLPVDEMNNPGGADLATGLIYVFSRTISLVINYLQIPIINIPFVFIVAPFISIIFLWSRIRKEDNQSFRKNLNGVSFEINKSPKELILDKLKSGNWKEEKQLFKLLIVLLPISLYLLTTLLKITGIEITDFTQLAQALGWFIEVFFAYLASFLLGIHLLKSSNVSFKGRYIGEKLQNDASSSLMSVGIPISILSILLFIVESQEAFTLILYFFGYFLMAAFIFVSYLVFFEPICSLILIKIINSIKLKEKRKEEVPVIVNKQNTTLNYVYPLIFGALSALAMLIIGAVSAILNQLAIGSEDVQVIIDNASFLYSPTFNESSLLEIIQIISNLGFIIIILLIGILFSVVLKNNKKLGLNSVLFLGMFGLLSIFFGMAEILFGLTDLQWITGKLISSDVFGEFIVYTLRTAFFDANISNPVLLYIAIPYQVTRYLFAILLMGMTYYYIGQKFFTRLVKIPNSKYVDQTTFSQLDILPSEEEFMTQNFLVTIVPDFQVPDKERDEVKQMVDEFKKGKSTVEFRTIDPVENKRIYVTLKYMTNNHWIKWWSKEFAFSFERAEINSMYIMYSDGRDVFSHMFTKSETDPALVAGMFSAITSFIKETTNSTDLLRSIDHGDSKITIEYGKYIFGAIFANMETAEIRSKLKTFITEFEKKHDEVLKKWNGNTFPFQGDIQLVKEIFE